MDVFKSFTEEKQKYKKVDDYFTPSKPVSTPSNLRGRNAEIEMILRALTTPGKHCMIYGDRGIGKSSLALSTLEGGREHGVFSENLFVYRCIKKTKFKDIIEKPAIFLDAEYASNKIETTKKYGVRLKLFDIFGGDASREEKITIEKEELTANKAARALGPLDGVLIIDEFDVTDEEVKHEVAEFVKQLSDADSKFKVLIVGIASDGGALIAGHQSVTRCLHEIKLPRVEDKYLEEIIDIGEVGLNITFSPEIKEKIISISSGFPYFTHLLGKECAEEAIKSNSSIIDESIFSKSLISAVKNTEGQLKRGYDLATTSSRTDMYPKILFSAAKFNNEQFSVRNWIDQISEDHGLSLTNGSMNNYTGKLIKEARGEVLSLVRRGVYKITDPRMPSYILMCNEANTTIP
ncbi:AAA family ATPase [Rahnella aceris]|uniref:AAA family ATPase n=1 Tax=Rahnella sp. (strain Y9602) TaxID=2703885 RepID=A0ABW6CJ96_RAHSY